MCVCHNGVCALMCVYVIMECNGVCALMCVYVIMECVH